MLFLNSFTPFSFEVEGIMSGHIIRSRQYEQVKMIVMNVYAPALSTEKVLCDAIEKRSGDFSVSGR